MKNKLLSITIFGLLGSTYSTVHANHLNAVPAPAATTSSEQPDESNTAESSEPASAALAPQEITEAHRELEQIHRQMRDLSRKMAELSMRLGEINPHTYAYRYLGDPERGMIGVIMRPDERGVRVAGLTPRGPAEKAGVKSNDIIVAIDNKPIEAENKNQPSKTLGAARHALSDLKAGQEVKLTVLHEGKKSDITVKAERREAIGWAHSLPDGMEPPIPPDEQIELEVIEHGDRQTWRKNIQAHHALAAMHGIMPWLGLRLASMNPDLGSYFGSDKGVLVISTQHDMATLKAGDVLLEIAGKPVNQPEQAIRLIRDQSSGSEFNVKLLRQHKQQTVSMKAPEFKHLFMPEPPLVPQPPTPPTPGQAPQAPVPPPSALVEEPSDNEA